MHTSLIRCAVLLTALISGQALAQPYAYIPNRESDDLSIIDSATNTVVNTIPLTGSDGPVAIGFHPSGSTAYITSVYNDSLTVLDIASLTSSTVPLPGVDFPYSIAIHPSGTRAYVIGNSNNAVGVIDLTTNPISVITTVGGLFGPQQIALNETGTKAYIGDYLNNRVAVLDTNTLTYSYIPTPGLFPIDIVVDASGGTAWVCHDGGTFGVTLITDLQGTPTLGATIATGSHPRGIVMHPDGSRVYVTNAISDTVSVVNTGSLAVNTVYTGSLPQGLSINPAGTLVYVANIFGNNISVFDDNLNYVTGIGVGVQPHAFGASFFLPEPKADLAVAVTASQASRRVGQTASFGVGINNAGPDASGATTLDLMLNAATPSMGLTAPAGWTCAAPVPGASDTTATCNTADLADGASAFFNVSVPVTDAMSSQPLLLSAVVDGSTADPVPGDNSDSAEVAVTSDANLRMSFSGPNNVRSGIRIPVYARLDNYGANAARNPVVNLSVPLPASAVSLTAPAGWSCTGGAAPRSIQITVVSTSFQCTYDTGLLPRTSVLFPLLITPPGYTAGSAIAITGNASSDSNDPVPGNNAASFNLNVRSSGGIISPVSPPIR